MEFMAGVLKARGSVQNFCLRTGRQFGFGGIQRLNPNFRTTPTSLRENPGNGFQDGADRGCPLQKMRFEWVAPHGEAGSREV